MQTLKHYSFVESYFKLLPEGRNRRWQYLNHVVGAGFFLFIPYLVLCYFASSLSLYIVAISFILIYSYMYYILSMKRVRDIGVNIALVQKLLLALFVWVMLVVIYKFLGNVDMIPGFVSGGQIELAKILEIPLYKVAPWHQVLVICMNNAVYFFYTILSAYLLFTPGKVGDNEYGPDPVNTRVSF